MTLIDKIADFYISGSGYILYTQQVTTTAKTMTKDPCSYVCMWKEKLKEFKQIPREHQNDEYRFYCLNNILKVKLSEREYSDFFKFLTEIVKIHPEMLEIVLERITLEWQDNSLNSGLLFKSTVSFLGRLKKSVRRQEFKGKISGLWPIIFNFPGEDRLKLHLVREYRRELPFGWLYEFVLKDDFFYNENLNAKVLDSGALAVVDILMELMDKSRGDNDLMYELRVSGLLEKIGSLWRSPALPQLVKLLTMASSIAVNNIFDSLPSLMDSLLQLDEQWVWSVRLVDSILRKYSKRQYVLSQSRAEISSISKQVIKITSKSLSNKLSEEINKSVCGLVKSVLERWDGMACSNDSELEFCDKVNEFLENSYKTYDDSYILNVFAKDFIDPLKPQITLFFRNSLKLSASRPHDTSALNLFTNILVNDGGTDINFPLLFKEYPSLIEDIHDILKIKGDEMNRLSWLLTLAESPRTKKVLIDFLIDPDQVNEMESNEFWISFMGRLTSGGGGSGYFEDVNKWSKGRLLEQFVSRTINTSELLINTSDTSKLVIDEYFFNLLKQVIVTRNEGGESDHYAFDDPWTLLFLLIICKRDFNMFNWITETFDCKKIILNNLKDLIPFENEKISRKVFEIVKNDLLSIDEILDFIFQSKEEKDKEKLEMAVYQLNLLIESKQLIISDESIGIDIDYSNVDYGNYLERLFDHVQQNNPTTNKIQLIKESTDPIETFLEYYKFGQLRSMKILQSDLLSKFKCSELLLRIPLVVLKATGPDFGGIILDSLIINGWDNEDLEIVLSNKCNEYNFNLLKEYYKNRIKIKTNGIV